jgi:hypothetical protein
MKELKKYVIWQHRQNILATYFQEQVFHYSLIGALLYIYTACIVYGCSKQIKLKSKPLLRLCFFKEKKSTCDLNTEHSEQLYSFIKWQFINGVVLC